jgi:bacterioferritin-associated ferredoxin
MSNADHTSKCRSAGGRCIEHAREMLEHSNLPVNAENDV